MKSYVEGVLHEGCGYYAVRYPRRGMWWCSKCNQSGPLASDDRAAQTEREEQS